MTATEHLFAGLAAGMAVPFNGCVVAAQIMLLPMLEESLTRHDSHVLYQNEVRTHGGDVKSFGAL